MGAVPVELIPIASTGFMQYLTVSGAGNVHNFCFVFLGWLIL